MSRTTLLSICIAVLIGILSALNPIFIVIVLLISIGIKMPSLLFAVLINGMFLLSYFGNGVFSGYQTIGTVALTLIGTIIFKDSRILKKKISPIILIFLVFGLYLSSSYIWSETPQYGLFKIQGYWLGIFLPLLALSEYARKDLNKLTTISKICIIFGLIAAVVQVVENGFSLGSRASVEGVNTIWFARYIGIALVFSYYFTFASLKMKREQKLLWLIPTVILFVSLVLNGSRGPLIAALLAILVIELIDLKQIKNVYEKILKVIIISFTTVGSLLIMLSSSTRLNYQNLLTDKNILERIEFIEDSVVAFFVYPFQGWGIGGFGIVSQGADVRVYPHNFILEIGIELGIIGVLFTVVIYSFIYKIRRYVFLTDLGRSWFILFVFLTISAMFSGDLFGNAIMWIPVAALYQVYRYNKNFHDTVKIRKKEGAIKNGFKADS